MQQANQYLVLFTLRCAADTAVVDRAAESLLAHLHLRPFNATGYQASVSAPSETDAENYVRELVGRVIDLTGRPVSLDRVEAVERSGARFTRDNG